ncbi:MAG: class IV adenylate cyclase [Acidobacteriota bacterium]
MASIVEREVKLPVADPAAARAALASIGAVAVRARRLQDDYLLDSSDRQLQGRGSVLRVRLDADRSFLTFKGPVQPSAMKLREELETLVGDGALVLRILGALGFHVSYRYQKYREEFTLGDVIIALDETPIGIYLEIEGSEQGIEATTRALGRSEADYVLESYRGLHLRYCAAHGLPRTDMLFTH